MFIDNRYFAIFLLRNQYRRSSSVIERSARILHSVGIHFFRSTLNNLASRASYQVDCVSTGKNSIGCWPTGTIRGAEVGRGRGNSALQVSEGMKDEVGGRGVHISVVASI